MAASAAFFNAAAFLGSSLGVDVFLAADFVGFATGFFKADLAADFTGVLATGFLDAGFLGTGFLAAGFFAVDFAAGFLAGFEGLATDLRFALADFATDGLELTLPAAFFLAGALTAGFTGFLAIEGVFRG